MAWTYILQCKDNTLYTGCTTDLDRRVKQHREGKGAKYTRGRSPLELVYSEESDTLALAQRREKEIQKMTKTEKLDLIKKQDR